MDTDADEGVDSGEVESKLERYAVRGHRLEVEVSRWTLTGTTHTAEELVIKAPRGTLTLKSDDESGELMPLIEEIHPAGGERWVLLGWSSYGEGMQTQHAWLVDGARGRPRIVDKLEWTTDRRHAGLALEVSSKPGAAPRVGIPLPHRGASGADEDAQLHNESAWQLLHGKRTLPLARVEKLPASEQHLMSVRPYTAPTGASPTTQAWSGRFVWFRISTRFVATGAK